MPSCNIDLVGADAGPHLIKDDTLWWPVTWARSSRMRFIELLT